MAILKFFAPLKRFIDCERGNVESALVLVPLLTLFLIATQISVAIHARNTGKISAQDGASKRAISGQFLDSDTFLHIYSPDRHQNLDLIISQKRSLIPHIISEPKTVEVTGIAIIENQR